MAGDCAAAHGKDGGTEVEYAASPALGGCRSIGGDCAALHRKTGIAPVQCASAAGGCIVK